MAQKPTPEFRADAVRIALALLHKSALSGIRVMNPA
jgi:hypothetical protein